MLNKETLRYKIEGDTIRPLFSKVNGALLDVAEGLLTFYRSQQGSTRNEIQDALTPHLYRAHNLTIARGLNKLIEDRCVFTDPRDRRALREQVFAASAAALAGAKPDLRQHHKDIAAELGMSSKQLYDELYADLPNAAVLEEFCELGGHQLMQIFNMAQAQGLLIYAQSMEIAIADTDVAVRRRLLKAMRFRRLLAQVKQDDVGNLIMSVSGPGSVLEQHQRYGLQLALFLPAIACAADWAISAEVNCPKKEKRSRVRLQLDASSGLHGENKFLGYIPDEVTGLLERLQKQCPDWQCDDQAPLVNLANGEILVPDLRIKTDTHSYAVEFFHRWHANMLRRRLQQMERGELPDYLVIGVDRSVLKKKDFKDLAEHPLLEQRGFLFSDFPSPTAIKKCLKGLQ